MEPSHLSNHRGPARPVAEHISRRKFLGYAGVSGLAATVMSGCVKAVSNFSKDGTGPTTGVNLGSGDIGILNFAYSLEQLEAAFYSVVVADPYENIPSLEYSRLIDIRDHEIAHREFLKNFIGEQAIQELNFNFKSVDFSNRDSVLITARTFEDLGVSAYNGACPLFADYWYLEFAIKIVSVEARHAAYIRDIISPGSFTDITDIVPHALDLSRTPAEVLAIAQPFFTEVLDGSSLPTA